MEISKNYKKTGKTGSIKWIIFIIIAVIIASYFFNFSVQEAVEDDQTQANFSYIKEQLVHFYNLYLKSISVQIWDFFVNNIWSVFTENLDNINNGEPTSFDQAAANLSINNY